MSRPQVRASYREVVARAVVRVQRVERELEDRMQAPHDCD